MSPAGVLCLLSCTLWFCYLEPCVVWQIGLQLFNLKVEGRDGCLEKLLLGPMVRLVCSHQRSPV